MSYLSIGKAAADPDLRSRVAACVAQEDHGGEQPTLIVDRIIWRCCAEPGWGEAWDSAVAAQNTAPGSDPAVITDAMILSAVQKHLSLPEAPTQTPA